MKEYQIRPSHYGGDENPFEPRKIEAHYDLGFNLGNVLKYMLRYKEKGGIEDLKKALTYMVFEIEKMEGKSQSTPSVSHQNKPLSKAEKEAFVEALDYPPQIQAKQLPYEGVVRVNCEGAFGKMLRELNFSIAITRAKDCDILIELLKKKFKVSCRSESFFIEKMINTLKKIDADFDFLEYLIVINILDELQEFKVNSCDKQAYIIKDNTFLLWED